MPIHSNWIKWAEATNQTCYRMIAEVREELPSKSPEELADIGFIFDRMYKQIDDLRKSIQSIQELAEKIACLKAMSETTIRGDLATATCKYTMSANLPHPTRDPEAYLALCDFLNIPQEMVQNDLFRIHWPGFSEWFTKRMAEGKTVPPGIDINKTHTHYKLVYRAKANNK